MLNLEIIILRKRATVPNKDSVKTNLKATAIYIILNNTLAIVLNKKLIEEK
ncbi:hypothetical protein RVIR1_00920 [Candidatus Rickettsiella viridis]|uniref:Uncharacterized protein n=1 Tax=Candidatus Rickettsiella viridis TaxID=676208 RepID=A0A2Z5UUK5_9COXI|nr:hypothetical protein RVIR1_00920 [Candidatus Rickettsiella viridis]